MVALQHHAERRSAILDAEVARDAVERAADGLPETLLALRPEQIRKLARTALDAERAVLRRRALVGGEPPLDEAAAAAADAAYSEVLAARAAGEAAANDSVRWLGLGNAWGIAGLAVAAALVVQGGFELMSLAVHVSIMAAGVGPIAMTACGLARRSVAALQAKEATARWSRALERAGAATMGELNGQRLAHRAWALRNEEAQAAFAVARDARAAWHRAAGPHHHPREAPVLIARLAVLRAAQLEYLQALIAGRMRPRELASDVPDATGGTPFDIGSAPFDTGSAPFDVVWAVPPDRTTAAAVDERTGLVSRIRGRRLKFWTR